MSRVRNAVISLAALGAAAVVMGTPAAEAVPAACPADAGYSTTGASSTWVGDADRRVTGVGPMTLSIAISRTDTVTGTIGGTTGFSVNGIIAAAKADINGSIASSIAAGTTYTGTYAVPSGKHGWLQWGSWGYSYHWSYGSYTSTCRWVVSKTGTAVSPTLSGKGFNHGLS